jgi:hypothetical protein
VLVTDYAAGRRGDEDLSETERDRAGEIAFRFYFGLAWRDGIAAGDPHPENLVLARDGRLCVLDFGLLRELDANSVAGERDVMRALAARDPDGVQAALTALGYAPDPGARDEVFEHLEAAGEWLVADEGFRRIDPEYVARILEAGYPPRSPYFGAMRRLRLPAPTLLMRRLEVRVLALLGDLRAGADWSAIAAEYHSGGPPSTALGREDRAFFA